MISSYKLAFIFSKRCALIKIADDYEYLWKEFLSESPNMSQPEIDEYRKAFDSAIKEPHGAEAMEANYKFRKSIGKKMTDHLTSEESDQLNKITDPINGETEYQKSLSDKDNEETAQSNQEIEDFYQNKKRQENSPNKQVFNQNDANVVLKSLLSAIKNMLVRYKLAPASINFIFYPNGNIGFTGGNVKAANLVRVKFGIDLQLAYKQYLMSYKKSPPESNIVCTISL